MNSDHSFYVQYASGEISSIMVWDLDRELLACSIPSSTESCISALVSLSAPYTYFTEVFTSSSKLYYSEHRKCGYLNTGFLFILLNGFGLYTVIIESDTIFISVSSC